MTKSLDNNVSKFKRIGLYELKRLI